MKTGKPRMLKTLYERFSHHRVDDLPALQANIVESLKEDWKRNNRDFKYGRTEKEWDLWEAIDRLNIQYSGKFYVSADCKIKFYSDAYCFRDAFEKVVIEKPFTTTDEKFMEVRVLGSDHKDAVLVVYKDYGSGKPFNAHIMRDKHSDFLLSGNIASDITNTAPAPC